MPKILVTGGAGFIGSHIVDQLLELGQEVTAYDNLSLGKKSFLSDAFNKPAFRFVEADLLNMESLDSAMAGQELVFHMAANSDISQGVNKSDVDLKNGTLATYNVLEAMRKAKVNRLIFASTSAIYGEATVKPTPENYGPLLPISLYGASKLACEGLISSFAHLCGMRALLFRFANIVGGRATHGALYDFMHRLKQNPRMLKVLGNGRQRKSYLLVDDCVDGMLFGMQNVLSKIPDGETQAFNLTANGVSEVRNLAQFAADASQKYTQIKADLVFGEEDRGWAGDVPFTWLKGDRYTETGWRARCQSDEAVQTACERIAAQVFMGK